jgi:SAM-dependent methyltransferase
MTKSEFVDIRPIDTKLKNLTISRGDIVHMPYPDHSISSLSSLHVVEHIGLGRYGDPIDPQGTVKACKELSRVLKPGGKLYLSLPIGRERICFNAHRIYPPDAVLSFCDTLNLESFSVVDDNGNFHENQNPLKFKTLSYGCGMFCFVK